jgi:FdrA protein
MTDEVVRARVFRGTYRDSVELMRLAADVEDLPGVGRAALLMATPANRDLLARAGLLPDTVGGAGPDDLAVVVAATDEAAAERGLEHAATRLTSGGRPAPSASEAAPVATIAGALEEMPAANLALVSTPGAYATAEALKALKRGLHVFVFSDNVSLEDEIELKRLGARKNRLVMGPECGTAILDGVPLGFANAVRRGRIGVAAASGTGLQEVACLIDRHGEGVSQAIGVGGRDLHDRVGGLMMLAAIGRLVEDPGTGVLVLVSKPPGAEVARAVLDRAVAGGKPVVVCFLGGDPEEIRARGAVPVATLDAAAAAAVGLARGGAGSVRPGGGARVADAAREEAGRLGAGQHAIRGLYSGGTLCAEAALVAADVLGAPLERLGHRFVDLGADEFTVGRPHPMIDFRFRNEHLVEAAGDPSTAVLLLDVVLGYGSHPDPAAALRPALEAATARAARAGRTLVVVASVCGTRGDPQDLDRQEERLRRAGVCVLDSNADAARFAALVARGAAARSVSHA